MPLGMEVGLSPGDFVLDGDPAPPLSETEAEPPICVLFRISPYFRRNPERNRSVPFHRSVPYFIRTLQV